MRAILKPFRQWKSVEHLPNSLVEAFCLVVFLTCSLIWVLCTKALLISELTLLHLSDRRHFWFYRVHPWSLFCWQQLMSHFWWWNRESTSGELMEQQRIKINTKMFKYLLAVEDMRCVCLLVYLQGLNSWEVISSSYPRGLYHSVPPLLIWRGCSDLLSLDRDIFSVYLLYYSQYLH